MRTANAPGRARGFTLVSAIFLMVVLATLATALVSLSGVQHVSAAQALQAARAHQAARAGLEWAAGAIAGGGCTGTTPLALDGALAAFTVQVRCVPAVHTLDAASVTYTQVDVTATAGTWGAADFVRRRLQAKVRG